VEFHVIFDVSLSLGKFGKSDVRTVAQNCVVVVTFEARERGQNPKNPGGVCLAQPIWARGTMCFVGVTKHCGELYLGLFGTLQQQEPEG
jgi:hypothetical protein